MKFLTYFYNFIECKTIGTGGGNINKPCVFPFKMMDTVYHGCIWEHNSLTAKNPWCSTYVDDKGNHIYGNGTWGFCGLECTGM